MRDGSRHRGAQARAVRALPEAPEPQGPAADDEPELADFLVYRPRPERRTFRIFRTDRGFRVAGRKPDDEELEQALRTAGVKPGDTVEVDGEEFEWE